MVKIFKIAIVGDGGVGKSSLIAAKKSKIFDENRAITIGVDFEFIPMDKTNTSTQEGQILAVDLGGQDRFHFIHDAYLRGIKGALIVFDVTRFRTFLNIEHWISLIQNEDPNIPILIVGNKVDLISVEQKKQFKEDLNELIEKKGSTNNLFGFIFTSAKEEMNIQETFTICEEMVIEKMLKN